MLVDLSVGMQKESPCMGHLIKNEAATKLIRKIVQRVPASPITASLRVFGYKYGLTEADNTALYYEPSTFNRRNFEHTLMRLMPSNSIANFSQGIGVLMEDLGQMDSPRGALLFSDFSVAKNSGDPPGQAKRLIDLFGPENRIFTFYLTDDEASIDLARRIAAAGGGVSYNVCELLENPDFLEVALEDIFGSNLLIPCQDTDKDGVCDDNDTCPGTPLGAPVDGRGCWIAAYSYFFDYDKTAVKAAFHPRVEYAAQIMLSNPQPPSVVISGYTDSQGTELYNLDLGKKRAESIRNLLIKFGVPAELLTVQSYGKSNPIADNSTEEGRAMNRRVEFTIANP
jgi:hypothetical protein